MDVSPSRGTAICSADRDILRLLWRSKVHYHFHVSASIHSSLYPPPTPLIWNIQYYSSPVYTIMYQAALFFRLSGESVVHILATAATCTATLTLNNIWQ
jgi:hypothetical protein